MEVQFYKDRLTIWFSLHVFHFSPVTLSYDSGSLRERDTRVKLAGKRKDKKHPSLAKRNRKPPSTCLRKCNQSRLWDEPKMPLLPHILHLRAVGNINLPGVRYKKALTVTLWKGLFTHANHASTVFITYMKTFNEQRWSWGSMLVTLH